MNLEQLKQAIEISKLLNGEACVTDFPIPVGNKVFIRTVTLYYTGLLNNICGNFITLENAAWIPDTGRFNDFLKTGKASEVEPFEDAVHIPMSSIIDVTLWRHSLPQEQK